jgi:hypothetical protein
VVLQGDLRDPACRADVAAASVGGVVGLVLSDMAPNTTGDRDVDHFRSLDLCNLALDVAASTLAPRGACLCKVTPLSISQRVRARGWGGYTGNRRPCPPVPRFVCLLIPHCASVLLRCSAAATTRSSR